MARRFLAERVISDAQYRSIDPGIAIDYPLRKVSSPMSDERMYQVTVAVDPAAVDHSYAGRQWVIQDTMRRAFAELWRGISALGKASHMVEIKWEAEVWVKVLGQEAFTTQVIPWDPNSAIPTNTHLLWVTLRTVPVTNAAADAAYIDPVVP